MTSSESSDLLRDRITSVLHYTERLERLFHEGKLARKISISVERFEGSCLKKLNKILEQTTEYHFSLKGLMFGLC